MAVRYFCDDCGEEGDLFHLRVIAEALCSIGSPTPHFPEYNRDLCHACFLVKVAEVSEFFNGLGKKIGE
jgi:hypothetical protein